jgi:Dual specificity phosphatase, catalytic domain
MLANALRLGGGALRPTATRVRAADGSVAFENMEKMTTGERAEAEAEKSAAARPIDGFMVESAHDPQAAAVCPDSFLESAGANDLVRDLHGRVLFVGSQDAAGSDRADHLAALGVRRILNVASGVPDRLDGVPCPTEVDGESTAFSCCAIECLDMDDFPLIPDDPAELSDNRSVDAAGGTLARCFAFLDQSFAAGHAVLVHCNAGVSRSVTVVLAYVMVRNGLRLEAAMGELREERSKIKPNAGFVTQLRRLDASLASKKDERS